MSKRLILFEELRPLKGIHYSRTTLKRKEDAGEFPLRVRHGRRFGYHEDEIDAHLAKLPRGKEASQ